MAYLYLKQWRRNHAEATALAAFTSSESDNDESASVADVASSEVTRTDMSDISDSEYFEEPETYYYSTVSEVDDHHIRDEAKNEHHSDQQKVS